MEGGITCGAAIPNLIRLVKVTGRKVTLMVTPRSRTEEAGGRLLVKTLPMFFVSAVLSAAGAPTNNRCPS